MKKSKTSNTRIFHYFSGNPRTKSQCVFWQSKTFRLTGIGIILVYISYWPDPGHLALSSKGWVWQAERLENSPHPTALCCRALWDGKWGWRLHTLTEIKAMCHKAFYNSSLSLTEGNRQPFFLQLKSAFMHCSYSAHNQMLCRSVPKISIQPNVCQSFRETLRSQNYLHSELNVL